MKSKKTKQNKQTNKKPKTKQKKNKTKQNKTKNKNQNKKKKSPHICLSSLYDVLLRFTIFPLTIFLLFFSIVTPFWPHFSRYVIKNFSVRSLLLFPQMSRLLRHWTSYKNEMSEFCFRHVFNMTLG